MGFDSRPKEWVKPHQNWCTRFWVCCPFDSRGLLVLGRTKPLVSNVRGTRFLKPDSSTGSMLETSISRLASSDGMEEGLLRLSFRSTMGRSGAIRAPGLREMLAAQGCPFVCPMNFIETRDYATLPALTREHVELAVVITKPGTLAPAKIRKLKIINQQAGRFGRGFVITPLKKNMLLC